MQLTTFCYSLQWQKSDDVWWCRIHLHQKGVRMFPTSHATDTIVQHIPEFSFAWVRTHLFLILCCCWFKSSIGFDHCTLCLRPSQPLQVSDFGLSHLLDNDNQTIVTKDCGSTFFAAPERVRWFMGPFKYCTWCRYTSMSADKWWNCPDKMWSWTPVLIHLDDLRCCSEELCCPSFNIHLFRILNVFLGCSPGQCMCLANCMSWTSIIVVHPLSVEFNIAHILENLFVSGAKAFSLKSRTFDINPGKSHTKFVKKNELDFHSEVQVSCHSVSSACRI